MTEAQPELTAAITVDGPTVDVPTLPICPFLVAESGEWRLGVPNREHRCTAFSPPAALAPEKQERLCLTTTHPTCATYIASLAAREARVSAVEPQGTRWRLGRTTSLIEDPGGVGAVLVGLVLDRRRWPAIPAVLLVTTLLTLALSGFRAGVPVTDVATDTPLASPTPTARPAATRTPEATEAPTPSPTSSAVPTVGPTTSPGPTPQPSFRTYRVRSGDTLSAIATRFGTTVRAIVDLNNLADPNRLSVGQILLIPS